MPVARNMTEARKLTAIQTAMLMRLEVPFAADLRRFLKQVSADFAVIYEETGAPINVSRYNDELSAILKKHYRKVAKEFKGSIRNGDKSFIPGMETKQSLEQTINMQIAEFIDERAPNEAALINTTTQQQLDRSVRKVQTNAALEGENLTNEQVAEAARRDYNTHVSGRADTISMTEAGTMQSTTQGIEESNLLRTGAVVSGVAFVASNFERMWDSILDGKTRAAHAAADSQRVDLGSDFLVGGENLRFPRDPNGSAGNVINCRCQAYNVPKL